MVAAPLLIGAGLSLAGSAGLFGKKKKGNAAAMMQQILAQYNGINVPSIEEQKIILQNLVQQGLVDPEDAATVELGDSAYNDINLDPRARQAQLGALEGLQESIDAGGLTPVDLARYRDVSDKFETERRGADQALIENAKERGIYGSNLELVNRMISGQGSATRASNEATDIASAAQQAKMQAIRDAGTLGGNIRGQEFSEASAKATAADAIRKWNASNRQTQINTNTAANNEAAAANLKEKQRLSDTNIARSDQNKVRDSELIHQNYQDKLSLADAKARALAGIAAADTSDEEQRRRDALNAGLLGLGGQIISTYGGK